jgi:hypothetical protein
MRRPQLTIRAALVITLLIGAALGFGLPAIEVFCTKESHEHTYVGNNRGEWGLVVEFVHAPFWPRYWRRLLGRAWRGQRLCQPSPDRLEEVCSLAQPEVVSVKYDTYNYTKAQSELQRRLNAGPTRPPPLRFYTGYQVP